MPSIELAFSTATFVVPVLLLLAAGLAYLFYRFTIPPVSKGRRLILSLLRGTALALVLVLLCEPLLQLVSVTRHPPVIAILADNSASCAIVDRSGDRGAIMARLLRGEIPASLPAGTVPRYYTFGAALGGPTDRPPDSLLHTDEVTDIAGALHALHYVREAENICAVVLLTDGVSTLGDNPLYSALAGVLPIFSVGIGDTAEQKDVLLSRLSANDIVYAGTSVPVDVTLRSTGFPGERVDVTLHEHGKILARTTVTLPAGSAETTVQMAYVPEQEGVRRYAVRVSPLPNELTADNNAGHFAVRVLKSKLRILIIAGGPGPDLAVLRQTLAEEKDFEVTVRTQKSGAGFFEAPLTGADIDSADCLVTIGMPTSATPAGTIQLVSAKILAGEKPVLSIGGKSLEPAGLARMVPTLPVAVSVSSVIEQEVDFIPDPTQRAHPLLALDPSTRLSPWTHLPPVFATQTVYRPREGSVVLGSPRLHSVVLPQPFLAVRSVAGNRSIAVLGHGLWRWRLMAQGNSETSRHLSLFLSASITWLTSRDLGRAVRVRPSKDAFSRGERIDFAAQVYNASAQPVETADLRLTVKGGDQIMETQLRPIGNGRYEGTLDGLPQGVYAFSAIAAADAVTLGADSGSFTVGGLNVEFQDVRMNAEILRQIAYRSGGTFFDWRNANELHAALDSLPALVPREEHRTSAIDLSHWHYALALLILLFATEWVLRKQSGML
jgi:hypothetical protein